MAEISKIDYTLGQDNVQPLGLDVHNPVFFVSSLTIVTFVTSRPCSTLGFHPIPRWYGKAHYCP